MVFLTRAAPSRRSNVRLLRRCALCFAMVLSWASVGCQLFDPDYQAITRDRGEVRLIRDSERVQRLISQQSADRSRERIEVDRYLEEQARILQQNNRHELEQLQKHPEVYIPERIAFLDAMALEPAIVVQPRSYCRVLQRSTAVCTRRPQENPYFVKVRVTSGKDAGQEGWGCLGDGIGLTVAWP
jgi:hypothetical protein